MRKSIIGTACTCLAVVSLNASAAIIEADWKTAGDNLITRDFTSGLDWLDLTETNGMSYDAVFAELYGGQFDGWRYATNNEVVALWSNFGFDLSYTPAPLQTNGLNPNLVNTVAIIGNTYSAAEGGPADLPYGAVGFTGDLQSGIDTYYQMGSYYSLVLDKTTYWTDGSTSANSWGSSTVWGSYLVQTSPVPIPAAVWLFGSGLIGLVGMARRKANA